jgi:hypothetical protein
MAPRPYQFPPLYGQSEDPTMADPAPMPVEPVPDYGQESDYPVYQYPSMDEPAPLSTLDRIALALSQMPQEPISQRFESGGSAFARNLVGGAARGFSGAHTVEMQRQEQSRVKENERRVGAADRSYRAALESRARRDRLEDARTGAMNPRWQEKEWWQGTPEEQTAYLDAQSRLSKAKSPGDSDTEAPIHLDGPELDIAAKLYLRTGQLPAMGMAKNAAGERIRVMKRAAEIDPEADIATNKATYGANVQALSSLRKLSTGVGAFEATMLANMKVLRASLKGIPDLRSPWLNTPLRLVNKDLLGSSEVAIYDMARKIVANEFGKIISNPAMSGVMSDSSRKEADEIMAGNYSVQQMIDVMDKVVIPDAHNRAVAYADAIKSLTEDIRKGGESSVQNSTIVPPRRGHFKVKDSSTGQTGDWPNGKPLRAGLVKVSP